MCGVKVLCQGRAAADGRLPRRRRRRQTAAVSADVSRRRPVLARLVPRSADPKGRYFVYYDNPKAARAAEQVVDDPRPGSGPAKGAWVPRFGFVLQTIERPKGDNPRAAEEMGKLIAGSPTRFGGRYQRRVADGYNSFGPSDYYISVYRGWVHVAKAGKYQFCTVSNEASFSFLDGKELIHWPGRHTAERGSRGEVNSLVELTAGPHFLEYYHEEVTLEQMAFLGWRPSADDGPFAPIPEAFFTAAHEGVVRGYETPKGPLPTFEPGITDSIWPAQRSEGQYTRVAFQPGPGLPAGATCRWEFGDGQTATGNRVDHVYLTLGKYPVTLTATLPGGEKVTATWPLTIFEIEHVTDEFKEGRPTDYLAAVKGYDRGKLSAAGLKELAFLHAEAEDLAGALAVGREFVGRFAASGDALMVARVRRLLADCALRQGDAGLEEAITHYRQAVVKELPATERIEVLGRLIRLVGVDRGQGDRAVELLAEAEAVMKEKDVDDDGRRAFRKAVAAAGDARLWQGRRAEAQKLYARAERLLPQVIPPQVRAARLGAYPNSLREYVAAGNYGAALDLVEQWDDLFPTDRLNGGTFFWRGKVLLLRGQPREAVGYLQRTVQIARGAAFETEARWLLAEALTGTGKPDEARKELAKLVASGLRDEFTARAIEKLKGK
ncbi:MAG: PKD domain-containing protein [Gemmataceae bacterium]